MRIKSKDQAALTTDSASIPRSRWYLSALAAVLYFSEGLPYGIVNELAPLYLRIQHVPLATIGLVGAVGSAWTWKVFWSPLVELGTYRRWISGALLVIAACLAAIAFLPATVGNAFWLILGLLAVASATQDIAVDAFTIRATPKALLGPVNSIRVMAYRIAIMAGGGGLAALAGFYGWRAAFLAAAAIALAIFVFTLTLPDDRAAARGERNLLGDVSRWLRRPRAAALLAMVLLYRLGEFAVVPMIKPFWVDRGYSAAEIGTITTVVGVIISVAFAVVGGLFIARFGLYRGMLWLGVAQVASNIGYAIVASMNASRWMIYAAATIENIGYGLGTAAFLAFLMAICDRERAATEYALLTAAFGVTRSLMVGASGVLAQALGYGPYFWLTVLLGIPALFLLPLVREDVRTATA
ncbi:MAG: major facilitator superfamily 1 [Acidobacteria bacterium]|nr:major facilitator superfamily 1 [Acidobacteriota bacterium]